MGARASDFWRWIRGGSGKPAPRPMLVDSDGDDEPLISVAAQNVPSTSGPSAARLRRAGIGVAQEDGTPSAAPQDPVAHWFSDRDEEPGQASGDDRNETRDEPAGASLPSLADDADPDLQTEPPLDRDPAGDPEPTPSHPVASDPAAAEPALADVSATDPDMPVEPEALPISPSSAPAASWRDAMVAPAPLDEPPLPYRLRVLTGLHEGAELELDEGVLTIGGLQTGDDATAELALADLGDTIHRLTLDRGMLIGPDPDASPQRLPCDIEIDGVVFAIEATDPDQFPEPVADAAPAAAVGGARESSGVAGPIGATVAGLALSLAILGATLPLVSETGGPDAPSVPSVSDARLDALSDRVAEIAPGVSVRRDSDGIALSGPVSMATAPALDMLIDQIAADLAVDPSRVVTSADAARILADRLSGGGLGEALTTDREGDVVRVSGALTEDQARFWSDVERWFTSQYAPVVTLESTVTSRAAAAPQAPRIGLQAVWVGHDPYLIAADGRRSRPGDRLPGGWRILDITPERVRLSRDGAVHDIQLAAAPAPVQAELRQTETPR